MKSLEVGLGIGSAAASQLACSLKPRYIFGGHRNTFFQRSPYRNPAEDAQLQPLIHPCTRFIGLSMVSSSKEKRRKWIHALSLEPITHLSDDVLKDEPEGVTDNPFLDIGIIRKPSRPIPAEEPREAKRSRFDHVINESSSSGGSLFFGDMGVPRVEPSQRTHAQKDSTLTEDSNAATSKTLFIGGFPDAIRDSDLAMLFPKSRYIRHPEGKGYAFIEFLTREDALEVINAEVKPSIRGRLLTVGWAKDKKETNKGENRNLAVPPSTDYLVPPSADCKTLYVGGLPLHESPEEGLDFQALFPGSVSVKRIPGKGFAFVTFEEPKDALSFLESTKGTVMCNGSTLKLGWAQVQGQRDAPRDSGGQRAGKLSECWFCLASPHVLVSKAFISICTVTGERCVAFAFTLYSPSLTIPSLCPFTLSDHLHALSLTSYFQTHLVVSVADFCYVALPRGGLVDAHALVIPIDCVSRRANLSEGKHHKS